ncbi:MAG: FAD-dependent thymidylate synthase [Lachnospiraceae bacterium]|nr:FAD-dependent thymidylate synthase [Lachnospiraceae bacterium]
MRSIRLKQESRTGKIRPVIRMVSMTQNPIGTLFAVWYGSRHSETVSAEDIQAIYDTDYAYLTNAKVAEADPDWRRRQLISARLCEDYPEHAGDYGDDVKNVIRMVVKQCIESDVPAAEAVSFVIEIDHANVAWREQLVRSKIASYWTQSTRTIDMTTMDINMSDSVELIGGPEAVKIYQDTAEFIRKAYRELEALGVPIEDIRLQPQQHVHRVYWIISIRALIKILNKRSDWIAQASLWTPVIAGVCKELREISLIECIEDFIGKPPVEVSHEDGNYRVSKYMMNADNEDRYYGRDPLPTDPLWLAYRGITMPENVELSFYDYMKSMYIQIWSDEYLKVLGWDRHDPTKIGPYDRPYSWFAENGKLDMVADLSEKLEGN